MSGIFDQIINYSPPLIVSGTVNYKGTWNASTNNPTLNSSPASSTKGDYYVVSTAGTQFGISFAIGDWIISNGTAWEKVDLTDAVSSVFGRTGAVVGVSTDYSAVGITNTAIGASNPSTGAFTTLSATTPIAGTSGGTGVNNGSNTITIAGNVTHAGAFTQSFTATANTALTLPTTGTLATLAGSEALSNKTITSSSFSGTTGNFSSTLFAGGVTTLRGANVPIANASGFLVVGSSDAAAADLGGSVGFTANTTSLSNYPMGNISARLVATGAGAYASYMAFATTDGSGTVAERMRLTSTGLGIGTTPTTDRLELLTGSSNYALKITASSSNFALVRFLNNAGSNQDATIGTSGTNQLSFYTNGFNERMRLTDTGLAVTGTLSTLATNGVNVFESAGISSVGLQFKTNSTNRFKIETPSASADLVFYSGGTTEVGRFSSTGLALTGQFNLPKQNLSALQTGTANTGTIQFYQSSGDSFKRFLDIVAGDDGGGGVASHIRFLTASGNGTITERVRIDGSGNVGINTSSPATKLEVVGPASVTSFTGTSNLGVRITGSTSTNDYSGIDFSASTQAPRARIGAYYSSSGSYLVFGTSNSYGSGITNSAMTIDYNGNVGIGTSSPSNTLQVANGNASQMRLSEQTLAYYYDFGRDNSDGFFSINGNQGLGYKWKAAGAEKMRLDGSGNLGLGTSSPATRLDVSGHVSIGVGSTSGFNFVLREYTTGTVRNWSMRDDGGVNRLRFSRGGSDQVFWDVTKVAASDQTADQYWYTNGSQRMQLSSTGLSVTGALSCTGALSKGSGSFRIEHPLPEKSVTHQLVHSFIEGPQADLIYRGKVVLIDGKASVNIDSAATMTEGTFEVLCREVQCFTTNESGWTAVRGKVTGNILTIEAKDADCSDEISWMVIGERKDPHMMETDWTDDNGKVIVEPLKPVAQPIE